MNEVIETAKRFTEGMCRDEVAIMSTNRNHNWQVNQMLQLQNHFWGPARYTADKEKAAKAKEAANKKIAEDIKLAEAAKALEADKDARIAKLEASLSMLEKRQNQPARDAAVKMEADARQKRKVFREEDLKDDGTTTKEEERAKEKRRHKEREEVLLESAKQNLDNADDHIQQAEKLAKSDTATASNHPPPAPKEEFQRL